MSPKMRIAFPVLALILIALAFYYLMTPKPYDEEAVSSLVIQKDNEAVILEEWKEYRPVLGTFIVSLPSIPQHASESVPLPEASDYIRYNMYLAQSLNGTTFLINVIQYPPSFDTSKSDVLLEGVVKEMMSGNSSNQLVEKTKGTFLTYPSIDFAVRTQNGNLISRSFMVDKTVYVLTVLDNNDERMRASFQKFVDGFMLQKVQQKQKASNS